MRVLARSFVVVSALALVAVLAQPVAAGASSGGSGSASGSGSGGRSMPKLSLPWADGVTWRLTGGPHANTGKGKPWSSLDFAGPVAGHSYQIRAAADGVVIRPCANWVKIRHANGWETSYYHVANVRVKAGEHVHVGEIIGWTSTQVGCGGSATGPHVHFSVEHNNRYVDLNGMVIGGWTVRDGPTQYTGCLVRGTERRCPIASVRNFGS